MTTLTHSIRPYRAMLSARFRMLLQYRAAAIAGVATQVVFGLVRVMSFEAFYRSSSVVPPMSLADAVSYIWLGQAMLYLTMLYAERDVQAMIVSGAVSYEMARPVDLYNFWYSRIIASRAAPLLLRAIPQFIIAGLFFGLQTPHSLACAALFLLSSLLSLLLASALVALMTVSLFWTISGEGIVWIVSIVAMSFSGMVVPLPLFPDWMQSVIYWLPFAGLGDTPYRLYMGHIAPADALLPLARQAMWVIILILIGRKLLSQGARRLVVQGG